MFRIAIACALMSATNLASAAKTICVRDTWLANAVDSIAWDTETKEAKLTSVSAKWTGRVTRVQRMLGGRVGINIVINIGGENKKSFMGSDLYEYRISTVGGEYKMVVASYTIENGIRHLDTAWNSPLLRCDTL